MAESDPIRRNAAQPDRRAAEKSTAHEEARRVRPARVVCMTRGDARLATVLVAVGGVAMPLTAVPTSAHAQAADDQGQAVPVPPDDEYADTDPSALTDFRPALDPYGTWVDDGTYGTAWTPNQDEVGADFVPYDSDGQWDYVDGDYLWVSAFAWGWVCFH